MRGRHRSRALDSVVREIRGLVAEGVKEINLISQDTTYYGMDLWDEKAGPRQPVDASRGTSLIHLLNEIGEIGGEFWVRLLYTHPAHWSDDLIAAIARNPHVTRYVDMPLQHIHAEMLKLMRRETSREHIENLITRIRAGIPGIGLQPIGKARNLEPRFGQPVLHHIFEFARPPLPHQEIDRDAGQ
jgi:ribosomal protein S12 methylthiotransferase